MPEFGRGAACATTPGERVTRGVLSIVVAGIAASMAANPWCAIPAAICSVFLMIGAITGWCPTDLVTRRRPSAPNTFGYPEALQPLDPHGPSRRRP